MAGGTMAKGGASASAGKERLKAVDGAAGMGAGLEPPPAQAGAGQDRGLRATLLCAAAIVGASSALLAPGAAYAQELTTDADAITDADTIVVTARHRNESAQSVPIAMSVYEAEDLRTLGVSSLERLTAVAPDVNFGISQGQAVVTIRGISSRDTSEQGDPAVTVSIDDFYMNRPYGLNASLYDIERVEVLRGPQGTLNGRNAVGGAINIITAKPVDEYEAFASVQFGNYNNLELEGMMNAPVGDNVQVRASFLSASRDGFRNNAPQTDGDDLDTESARLAVAFQPFDRLSGLVTAQYTSVQGTGDVMQYIPFIYTPSGALDHNMPPGIDSESFPLGTQPFIDQTSKQLRLKFTYDLGPVEVTALGGYDSTDFAQGIDQTLPDGSTPVAYQWRPTQSPDTYNAELRIASTLDGPLQWQLGGFYFREVASLRSGNAAPLAGGGYDEFFGFVYHTRQVSEAVYAQASYQITDALTVTGGARYTRDEKSEYGYFGNLSAGIVYGEGAGEATSSSPTYHIAFDYALTPDSLLYAKYDTGYKSGGFNLGGSTYGPERVKAIELGSKNTFLDGALRFNVAAYYNDYTDQQVATYAFLDTGQPVQLTLNAGASEIYGVETDITYDIPAIGTIGLNVNYLHARYTDFPAVGSPSDPAAAGTVVQLAGNTPPQAPTWSLGASFERGWSVLDGELRWRLQTKAQTSSNFSFYNFPDTEQEAYAISDTYLTYAPDGADWSVTGFVRNLEDAVVFRNAEESQYAVAYGYEFMPPRTYGVRLQYSW